MKSGVLVLVGGALALTGCSSQSVTGHPSNHRNHQATKPRPVAVVTRHGHGSSSADPSSKSKQAPTAVRPKPSATPVKGTPAQQGKAYLAHHSYKKAEAAYQKAKEAGDRSLAVYAGLGESALRSGHYKVAYRAYLKAAELSPHSAGILYRTAYAALYAKRYQDAITWSTRYIKMRPRDPAAYHLRLLANGQLYHPKQQLADAQTIVRLRRHDAQAENDLGIAFANVGKYGPAIAAFGQAIRLAPRAYEYYLNRAVAENYGKDQPAALTDLEHARRLTSDPATRAKIDLAIKALKKRLSH